MSGYQELVNLGVTFRPFDGRKPDAGRVNSPFSASWTSTVEVLAQELRALDATMIVVELDLGENDLRVDGLPRAQARFGSDAVRISFESKYGPLQYETNEFGARWYGGGPGWQQNVRAIALGLEALRKVDRYGISRRGEQYTGWKQLARSTDPADSIATREQAHAVLDAHGGLVAALKATHPDAGGDPVEFRKVMRAKELVG